MKLLRWLITVLLTALATAMATAYLLTRAYEWQPNSLPVPLSGESQLVLTAKDLAVYIGSIVRSFFPWPFVVLASLFLLFRSPSAFVSIVGLLRLFRKIKLLGAEVELTEQTKRQIRGAARDLTEALTVYRDEIDVEIQREVARLDLERLFERLVEEELRPQLDKKELPRGFRCTIHTRDFVLQNHLYQLLNYYPLGTGRGRSFSERYGIIGKVWRSGLTQVVGNLLPDLDPNASESERVDKITRDWGMTRSEAKRALAKPSYACSLISHLDHPLGVLYMDSTEKEAFTGIDGKKMETLLKDSKLTKALSALYERVDMYDLRVALVERL